MGNFSSNPSNSIGIKWTCKRCTFENDTRYLKSEMTCAVCNLPSKFRRGDLDTILQTHRALTQTSKEPPHLKRQRESEKQLKKDELRKIAREKLNRAYIDTNAKN